MRDFERPGRSLAVGREGMAATSHPTATLTAVEVLKAGGNAVDAAVAACAIQGVVESGSTGVGGDCFALLALGGRDKVIGYNGSGRTPAGATLHAVLAGGVIALERSSPQAVTVPGAVDAWTRLVADHGRMSIGELLAPAAGLARDGYGITPRVSADIGKQLDLLRKDPVASQIFLEHGDAPAVGMVQRQPALAATLETIGREGRDGFYRGAVAEDMVAHLRERGGLHQQSDFDAAAGEYVTPLTATYRGWTVHECPPNGQGVIALMILKILERFTPCPDPLDPDNLHVEVEATRLAYAARDAWLADPALAAVPVEHLLSDSMADVLASRINLSRATDPVPVIDSVEHSDTVYIAVVDRDRNAVSFINSLFNPYGSGIVAPRSGVLFHNRGQSFSLTPGHPNVFGPHKRPMHTIIPGMVTRDGRAVMPFGVMGGHYQAMGHAHLLSKLFDHRLDLQSAMDLPRLFPLPGTATIEAEALVLERAGEILTRRGFKLQPPQWAIGGAQAIWIDWAQGTLLGGSDHRKDGCAVGF